MSPPPGLTQEPRAVDDLDSQLAAAKRMLAARKAKDDLIRYAQFLRPDPDDFNNTDASAYHPADFHCLIADKLEAVEAGTIRRLGLTTPPQHGKSTLASESFIAWFLGRNPRQKVIFGTYNDVQAKRVGGNVRSLLDSPQHRQVFPNFALGKAAEDYVTTKQGGSCVFIGRGGSGTGIPADLIVIDDPLKGDEEARSATTIASLHSWWNSVIKARARRTTRIMVIHTRWTEDDLLGRCCDPDHPWRLTEAGRREARRWKYMNIPAILQDDEVTLALKRKPGEVLWPAEFSMDEFQSQKDADERVFSALYMGKPTPDDGDYFKVDGIVEYEPDELPKELRIYGASDHAVSVKKQRDDTVLGCVGICPQGLIWVLPDLVMRRMETDRTVAELISQFKTRKPQLWWMEDELISKSFGPFLRKQMVAESAYTTLVPVRPGPDKLTRARSAQGLMSLKRFRFPRTAPWWLAAKSQLLKFPIAQHDDFVDWLAHIGAGCQQLIRAEKEMAPANDDDRKVGSIDWILKSAKARVQHEKRRKMTAGW